MLYRYLYMGFGSTENIKPKETTSHVFLSAWDGKLFLYYETDQKDALPESVVSGQPDSLPDGTAWIPMPEIFHYSAITNEEEWKRKMPKTPSIRVVYLRPEMVASYVFYHYQLQEEKRHRGDKYYMIGLLGNFLVSYNETPVELDDGKQKGSLKTHNTPRDWHGLMELHFAPWKDFDGAWRETTPVFYRQ